MTTTPNHRVTAQEARNRVLSAIKAAPEGLNPDAAYTVNIIRACPELSIRQIEAALTGLLKRGLIRDDRNPVEAPRYVAVEES